MAINKFLEQLGLIGKKADVYLASLELGSATVIEIAKKSGVKRTTCYDILLDLEKQGLVSETVKGKRRFFIGEDPEKIKKDLLAKQEAFSEILPELKSIYNIKGVKPKIRFYEGKEGLKEVYSDTLKYSGEIMAFASEDVVKALGPEWADSYLKQRVKKGIRSRAIIPATKITKEYILKNKEQLRQTKLLDPEKYPLSIEINIYGYQKVALISSREETGIIIEGAEIYKTMKLIFEFMWNSLPEVKPT